MSEMSKKEKDWTLVNEDGSFEVCCYGDPHEVCNIPLAPPSVRDQQDL